MGGQMPVLDLPRDDGSNDRRTVLVADVVLDDQHRTDAALLRAHHRG